MSGSRNVCRTAAAADTIGRAQFLCQRRADPAHRNDSPRRSVGAPHCPVAAVPASAAAWPTHRNGALPSPRLVGRRFTVPCRGGRPSSVCPTVVRRPTVTVGRAGGKGLNRRSSGKSAVLFLPWCALDDRFWLALRPPISLLSYTMLFYQLPFGMQKRSGVKNDTDYTYFLYRPPTYSSHMYIVCTILHFFKQCIDKNTEEVNIIQQCALQYALSVISQQRQRYA